jgi:acyl-CoA thioester hydrolase
MPIQTPFTHPSEVVRPEWIDYNGHMNIGYYLVAFDNAAESFFHQVGLTPEFRKRNHSTTFALESHLNYLREVKQGDMLRFESRLLDFDAKRLHFYMEMFHAKDGFLAASFESMSSHVDSRIRKTAPFPDELLPHLAAVKAAHSVLPRPWQVGHVIGTKPGPK